MVGDSDQEDRRLLPHRFLFPFVVVDNEEAPGLAPNGVARIPGWRAGQLAEEVPAPGRIARVDEVAGQCAGDLLANGEMSPGDRVTAVALRSPAGEGRVEARDLGRSVRRHRRRASRTC